MSLVVGMDDIGPDQIVYKPSEQFFTEGDQLDAPGGPGITRTVFYQGVDPNTPVSPTAFISKYEPGRKSDAHYHAVDQFQVILEGKGKFARRVVAPYAVHFTRAYTSYGPLLPDPETGWTLLVLRTRYDPGSQHGSAAQSRLKQMRDRQPWQVHRRVTFAAQCQGIDLRDIPDIDDDQGLFACSLMMAPDTTTTAPDARGGDGQFIVVVTGSLVNANKEQRAPVVVFVKPDENAFSIRAGSRGLQALILNLPQVRSRTASVKASSTATGYRKWQCVMCAFSYDEALGMPEEGIAPGTRWEDVPESWSCPDCSASKSDFEICEITSGSSAEVA